MIRHEKDAAMFVVADDLLALAKLQIIREPKLYLLSNDAAETITAIIQKEIHEDAHG